MVSNMVLWYSSLCGYCVSPDFSCWTGQNSLYIRFMCLVWNCETGFNIHTYCSTKDLHRKTLYRICCKCFFFLFFFFWKSVWCYHKDLWNIEGFFFFVMKDLQRKKAPKKRKKMEISHWRKASLLKIYYIILYQERTRNILEILVCSIVLKEDLLCYYYSDMLLYSVWTIFIASKAWLISNHYTTPIFHEQDFRLTAGRAKASSFHVFSSTA